MISPAYESFVNDICYDAEYDIANENVIVDGIRKVIDTIKMLWKKFIDWVTSMVKKFINFFKKAPKEATAEEIKKADAEVYKKSSNSSFDKDMEEKPIDKNEKITKNQYNIAKKYDIHKIPDSKENAVNNKDNILVTKDKTEASNSQNKESVEKNAKTQEDLDKKFKKEIHDANNKIVKKVILSEDAYYWCTNAQSYVGNMGLYYDDIIEIAKDDNATIDDASDPINRIEKVLSKKDPNDLHTLESDYIKGYSGTPESKKVGYMSYELFLAKSKKTVNNISWYINSTNKKIQNISEIHNAELANKILELSRKLISFYQQILNNVNSAIQTAHVVNIRRKDGFGKSFD